LEQLIIVTGAAGGVFEQAIVLQFSQVAAE
jgi:hypothetical protein